MKQPRVSQLLKELRDYIFENDHWLNMMRNLHLDRYNIPRMLLTVLRSILGLSILPGTNLNYVNYLFITITIIVCRNLRELLNEAHHATLLHPRIAAAYEGLLQPGQKLGKEFFHNRRKFIPSSSAHAQI